MELEKVIPIASRLARHYRAGAGWTGAFAGLLAELFTEEGLVLLDPRDPRLAPLAAPVHRRALVEWREIVEALRSSGAPETVHVRDDAPLSFFHPDGPEGRRVRLRWDGGRFEEIGGTGRHTLDGLVAALEAEPLRFSTSALLRPILQDTWLRKADYVGGPAEVRYFEQLGPLHDRFGHPRPTIVPRASLTILEEGDRKRLERAGIAPEEAARPTFYHSRYGQSWRCDRRRSAIDADKLRDDGSQPWRANHLQHGNSGIGPSAKWHASLYR